ncbi:hypothetical protein BIZ42_15735 [Stenotrophomonas sp. LM091]|nr:hypothetical protein BIZ42_15735 [Stenotrophomonas sp. LM091]
MSALVPVNHALPVGRQAEVTFEDPVAIAVHRSIACDDMEVVWRYPQAVVCMGGQGAHQGAIELSAWLQQLDGRRLRTMKWIHVFQRRWHPVEGTVLDDFYRLGQGQCDANTLC